MAVCRPPADVSNVPCAIVIYYPNSRTGEVQPVFAMPFVIRQCFGEGELPAAKSARSSRTAGKVRRVQDNDAVAVPVKRKPSKRCSLVQFGDTQLRIRILVGSYFAVVNGKRARAAFQPEQVGTLWACDSTQNQHP